MALEFEQFQNKISLNLPQIRSMGLMAFDPIWSQKMHDAGACELIWVQKGVLELVTEECTFAARPGQILLIPAGMLHRDQFDLDVGLEVFIIFFHWASFSLYQRYVTNQSLAGIELSSEDELTGLFESLRSHLNRIEPADQLATRGLLLAILLSLLAKVQSPPPQSEDDQQVLRRKKQLLDMACAYLNEHYNQCIALDDIADALDISPYYLSHIFSEQAGFSLFAYLTSVRLENACRLLRDVRMNVSQVARAVGYDTPNYFAKVFKKHLGCSPSQYRRKPFETPPASMTSE